MIHDLEMLFAFMVLVLFILAIPSIVIFAILRYTASSHDAKLPSILDRSTDAKETKE